MILFSAYTAEPTWKDIDPTLLNQKESIVDKNADAEIIFGEVKIGYRAVLKDFATTEVHEFLIFIDGPIDPTFFHPRVFSADINIPPQHTVLESYIRTKIFNESGCKKYGTIQIPYSDQSLVNNITGRTVKPNGKVVELKKSDIIDGYIDNNDGTKSKTKIFSLPEVEPGCIIEYRWEEIRAYQLYYQMDLQSNISAQKIKYLIKPFKESLPSSISFNAPKIELTKEGKDFYSTTLQNVPAYQPEPFMPPEEQVKKWAFLFYAPERKFAADKYWNDLSKNLENKFQTITKPNKLILSTTKNITINASSDEEKIEKIFHFCQNKITNVNKLLPTDKESQKFKENKTVSDALKQGMGSDIDILLLSASLVKAVGINPHLLITPKKTEAYFDKNFLYDFVLYKMALAIKIDNDWRFFDPSQPYLPYKIMPWQNENTKAIITSPTEAIFIKTPMATPENSLIKRTANLKLDATGNLEGEVSIEYTGHCAAKYKENYDYIPANKREDEFASEIKRQQSTAELTNIKIENITDSTKPFTCSYHIKIPNYAKNLDQQLLLKPAFFQQNLKPIFTNEIRKYPIHFHHAWSEEDMINIELPKEYKFDTTTIPLKLEAKGLGEYQATIDTSNDGEIITYKRNFTLGKTGNIVFPAKLYPQIKDFFYSINRGDSRVFALKQK